MQKKPQKNNTFDNKINIKRNNTATSRCWIVDDDN